MKMDSNMICFMKYQFEHAQDDWSEVSSLNYQTKK